MQHQSVAKAFNTWRKDKPKVFAEPPPVRHPPPQRPQRGVSMRLLGAGLRPKPKPRPPPPRTDDKLLRQVGMLEEIAKQLHCMRLEDRLGDARATARVVGWHPHTTCGCMHLGTCPRCATTTLQRPPPTGAPVVPHAFHYR